MDTIRLFLVRLTVSEWLSFFALIISIASFLYSYLIHRSKEGLEKLQMLPIILETLTRDKWEIYHAIEETKDYAEKLDKENIEWEKRLGKNIDTLNEQLKSVDNTIDTLSKALNVGLKIEHKDLLVLHAASKSMLISMESLRKNVTSKFNTEKP